MAQDVNYDDGLYASYDDGQSLPEGTTRLLLDAFDRHAPVARPLTVLDLGSGTGRFSGELAERFGGPVYGIEPSARMLALAISRRPHHLVSYLPGRAERIPLGSASCDLVLMFLVFHHIEDRPAALAEIGRVLRPGGRVLICGNLAGRPSPRPWSRFFPRAHDVEEARLPTVADTEKAARRAGLELLGLESLELVIAPSWSEYLSRLRHRAISALRHLTELELVYGLNALEAEVALEPTPAPVLSTVDLLVLGRGGGG